MDGSRRMRMRTMVILLVSAPLSLVWRPARAADPEPPRSLRVLPRDESVLEPSLRKLRDRLVKAVRERDRTFVISALDPRIASGPGGPFGIAALRERWRIDDPTSDLWAELGAVLDLGGTFVDAGGAREFVAPYTSTVQLPAGIDPADAIIVTARRTALRSSARRGGRVVDWLSHELVRAWRDRDGRPGIAGDWIRVVTLAGTEGYLPMGHLRSPTGYRAHFRAVGGRWLLHAFFAGLLPSGPSRR